MPSFNLTLLIPLLAAHFLSDFTLQTDGMARAKGRPLVLLLHLAITTACAYLLLGDFREWRIPLLIFATHGLIDLTKLRFNNTQAREAAAFVADQAAHLLVIFAIAAIDWRSVGMVDPWWMTNNPSSYLTALLIITGLIVTTQAAGVFIAKLLPALLEIDSTQLTASTGFAKAGRYIGYLERLLLFAFVLTDQLAAAGFLIAAKSIFRFQKDSDDRKQTEYVLLGTLLSFTIGILLSFAIKALLP